MASVRQVLAVLAMAVGVYSQAAQPDIPQNQAYLGVHIDTSNPPAGSTGLSGQDTPQDFNTRMGFNAAVFGITQTIPLDKYNATLNTGGQANSTWIELTGTSAMIMLTVTPRISDLSKISDQDYDDLGRQIKTYMDPPYNRRVFLRFAPEMNSAEKVYGLQPTAFKDAWKTMASSIRKSAPGCALVWSPKSSDGYPWGAALGLAQNQADWTQLDTNHNNQLDQGDDAYAPYKPDDPDYDWAGIVIRYKGETVPANLAVTAPPDGTIEGALNGQSKLSMGGFPNQRYTDFYGTYCTTKPCAITELAAAWHANTTINNAASQQDVQSAWWNGWLTPTFIQTFPNIHMVNLWEFSKAEDTMHDLRDYRVSDNQNVRQGWLSALQSVRNSFVTAEQAPVPKDFSGSSPSGAALAGTTESDLPPGVSMLPSQSHGPNVFSNGARGKFELSTGAVVATGMTILGLGFGGMIGLRG